MRITWLRNSLIATTGIATVLLAGVGAWALLGGTATIPDYEGEGMSQPSNSVVEIPAKKEPLDFNSLWSIKLQAPRNAPSAEKNMVVAQPTTRTIGIQLVGTMIDASKTLGLFQDQQGAFDLKGVGQPLELKPAGVQVANIAAGSATLRFEGREIPLSVTAGLPPVPQAAGTGGTTPWLAPTMAAQPSQMAPAPAYITPMNPSEALPEGEEDIFALPANMIPYGPGSESAPGMSMESVP